MISEPSELVGASPGGAWGTGNAPPSCSALGDTEGTGWELDAAVAKGGASVDTAAPSGCCLTGGQVTGSDWGTTAKAGL